MAGIPQCRALGTTLWVPYRLLAGWFVMLWMEPGLLPSHGGQS